MHGVIHISLGGPDRKISVGGKILTFEDHPYCGPVLLKRNGDPARHQPNDFLEAASLWCQQGRRLDENGIAIWDTESKPITQHMGGRHHKVIGHTKPTRGS